jgi:kynurenine formamidase
MRMLKELALAASLTLVCAAAARADCSPTSWQDCKGKPWVTGDTMDTPIGEKWWPNKQWGAGDEAGSTNWYTKPEVVLRAIAEADKGKTYKLGRPYEADMPTFGPRKWVLRIPGSPTGGPFAASSTIYHDEYIATEIGQIGTQFDGLGHIGVAAHPTDKAKMYYYNGVTEAEMFDETGLKKNGIEKLHPIVARGILLDIAAARGTDMLDKGYEVTMADVKAALEKQGMADFKFMEGDAVLFHTGWGNLWKKDNARFNSGEPGFGMEVARWLSDEVKVGLYGSDTWAGEAVPNPDPGCAFCVHEHMLTRNGIVHQENANFDDLIKDKVYRFMYVYTPMPIVGATGSAGSPLAID